MTKIVIWGAGDQARVNCKILDQLGHSVAAFIDNTPGHISPLPEVPLFQSFKSFLESVPSQTLNTYEGVVAIGNPFGRARLEFYNLMEKRGIKPFSLIDKTADLRSGTLHSVGLQVMPQVFVGSYVSIGAGCILNSGASVDHDCIIGNGVEIGPKAVLTGRVNVGDFAWIGAGAIILPRVKIGKNVIIGAGAVVTKSIPDNCVFVGNPARFLKPNSEI